MLCYVHVVLVLQNTSLSQRDRDSQRTILVSLSGLSVGFPSLLARNTVNWSVYGHYEMSSLHFPQWHIKYLWN